MAAEPAPGSEPAPTDLTTTLRTTGAVRSFGDRVVDDATIAAILDTARFAPSGGNRQPWRVAVVRDPSIRAAMIDLMRPVWNEYVAARSTGVAPFNPIDHIAPTEIVDVPNPLLDDLGDGPAMLAIAADLTQIAAMDGDLDRFPIVGGASIYPFCWSILLAARAHRLGGVLTTFLARAEPQAAPILGLPTDHALAATIILGEPIAAARRLSRHPVGSFTTIDRFDGPPLSTT